MLRNFLLSFTFILVFIYTSKAQTEDLFLVSTIPAELKVKSNAVIRYDYRLLKISDLKTLNESYTRVVTVLNQEGDRNVNAQLYYDENTAIKKLGAIIYDQFGKEIQKFRKSDFEDVSAVSDFSLYEDSRIKYMGFTPIEYPYTVKFFYETSSFNTAALPSWHPLKGYYVSTQNSKLKVVYSSEVGLNKSEYNFENYDIINSNEGGILIYETQNIIAIKPEAYSPRFNDFAPHVRITPNNFYYEGYTGHSDDWSSLGRWMYEELLKDGTQLSETTTTEIKALVVGIDDPIEKAKIVYKYMQDRTRYISVQEGIGGIQPIIALKVDEVKYGDCKGLTNYTKALMDVVGVKSNYSRVFASRRNTVDVDEDFVSFLGQTNHVILNIPNGEENIWLECTSQTNPFNYIANFTDDRDVFVITPEGGKIVHTTAYKTEENIQTTDAEVSLALNGSLKANVVIEAKGFQYALHEGTQNKSKKNQDLHFKEYWDYINNLTVEKVDFVNNKDNIVFTEYVDVSASNYAKKSGKRLLFQPNMFNRVSHIPTRYKKRTLDFEIERGFTDIDEFIIQFDSQLEIEAMPSPISVSNKFGSYSFSIEKISSHQILYRRTYILNKGQYSKEDYDDFRSFSANIVKHDKTKIVFISKL